MFQELTATQTTYCINKEHIKNKTSLRLEAELLPVWLQGRERTVQEQIQTIKHSQMGKLHGDSELLSGFPFIDHVTLGNNLA
jgi:hypothetical protein